MTDAIDARSHFVEAAGREIHVLEWGDPGQPALVLWHGLARTAHDFAPLAAALAGDWRLLAPDTPGRGLSQWADDPAAEYCLAVYAETAVALAAAFGLTRFSWVGTSMGGALGLGLAAGSLAGGALAGRIGRLVINDIGPEVPQPAIERILAYAGSPPAFARVSELEGFLRQVYRPFGALGDGEWRRMAETSARRLPDGRITTHYDPRMVEQFVHHPDDYVQWDAWTRLETPTLVLRGADSDLLTPAIARRMQAANPRPSLLTVPGCGHAPALNVPAQTDAVAGFLAG